MSEGHIIEAWFDGVCEPVNPGGHAAWGIRICVDGKEVHTAGGYIGCMRETSNNVAEYCGVSAAMRWVRASDLRGILTIRGDSKLVICQLAGEDCEACNFKKWQVHGGFYETYYREAKMLLDELRTILGGVVFEWIPREKNSACDFYSKKVLLERGVQFRIQPETVSR